MNKLNKVLQIIFLVLMVAGLFVEALWAGAHLFVFVMWMFSVASFATKFISVEKMAMKRTYVDVLINTILLIMLWVEAGIFPSGNAQYVFCAVAVSLNLLNMLLVKEKYYSGKQEEFIVFENMERETLHKKDGGLILYEIFSFVLMISVIIPVELFCLKKAPLLICIAIVGLICFLHYLCWKRWLFYRYREASKNIISMVMPMVGFVILFFGEILGETEFFQEISLSQPPGWIGIVCVFFNGPLCSLLSKSIDRQIKEMKEAEEKAADEKETQGKEADGEVIDGEEVVDREEVVDGEVVVDREEL